MENTTSYFDNHYDDVNITPQRLCDFGSDNTARLTIDGNSLFTPIITNITAAVTDLQDDINGVDTSLNAQKGKTSTVDGIVDDFGKTMKDMEINIAVALGGRSTEAYGMFYPDGTVGEYTQARKEQMITLTSRVFEAATTYTTELGSTLATLLKSYKALWAAKHTEQQTQIVTVGNTRTTRTEKRIVLEVALTKALGMITVAYAPDTVKCLSLVNFSKLYPAHHQHVFPFNIPANGMVAHEHHFAADGKVELEVVNDVNLRTFLSGSETMPQGQMQETVGIGKFVLNIAAYNVDTTTNIYLLIFNLSTGEIAEIKLRIL